MKLPAVSFSALASMAPPRSTGAGAPTGASADTVSSKQEEMAARKLQQAKDAVATLKAVKTKTDDDQKARAAQKVKELKARLQALKMIYAGDPKKLARAAAQIARELAGAVKSYTSAGGSPAELGGTDSGDASSAGAAPAGETKAEGADAGEATPAVETAEKDKAAADGDAAKPEAATAGATQSVDAKRAADAERAKAEDEFKNDARALARELKAALRRKDHKHRDDSPGDASDKQSGEQALASVEQAVGALPMADVAAVSALAGI
ncbi:hypothetical protein [Sphingomonas sp. 22176]|uniref:hypothetical protein n=1 Tax=Sphingomonas sp. 22176 TaxID=3453884 RepID=UPI003F842E00